MGSFVHLLLSGRLFRFYGFEVAMLYCVITITITDFGLGSVIVWFAQKRLMPFGLSRVLFGVPLVSRRRELARRRATAGWFVLVWSLLWAGGESALKVIR